MKKFKVAIIGSRTFIDIESMHKYLDTKLEKIEMIISGGAQGADEAGRLYCQKRGIPCLIYYPAWRDINNVYFRGAGFARNNQIIKAADLVISWWDGQSAGTKNSMDLAVKYKKKLIVHRFEVNKVQESAEKDTDLDILF